MVSQDLPKQMNNINHTIPFSEMLKPLPALQQPDLRDWR
jgi:hypothetical protein